jgi:hypothetical protein
MGNSKSAQGANDFFKTIGSKLNNTADGLINTISAPGNMAKSMGEYLNSPMGGMMVPILALGGLYIASQFLSNRR